MKGSSLGPGWLQGAGKTPVQGNPWKIHADHEFNVISATFP